VGGGKNIGLVEPMSSIEQDYEELPTTSETFVYVAMTRLMLKTTGCLILFKQALRRHI